jgi:hypothetical protein
MAALINMLLVLLQDGKLCQGVMDIDAIYVKKLLHIDKI